MYKIKEQLLQLQQQLIDLKHKLDIDTKPQKIRELESETMKPGFWDDDQAARKVTQELSDTKTQINQIFQIDQKITDALTMLDPALETDLVKETDSISRE